MPSTKNVHLKTARIRQEGREVKMAQRSMHFCQWPGCSNITADRFCNEHRAAGEEQREQKQRDQKRRMDCRRGSARQRGYDTRWSKYSKWFLSQPHNQVCALHLDDGCAIIAQCVDHIDPPDGPNDPRFWDTANHQPACIHCNSVKGHRKITGEYTI